MIDTPEIYAAATMLGLTLFSAVFWYALRWAE
jgi:hypothetical protein